MENKQREIIKFDSVAEYLPIVIYYYYDYNEDLYLGDGYDEYFDDNMNYKYNHPIWEDYAIIDENISEYDLVHGWMRYIVIVKRESDGKYFRGSYDYMDCLGYDLNINPILTEVFPKEVIKTIYE